MEVSHLLKDTEWEDMMAEFGEFYNLPKEEKILRTSGVIQGVDCMQNILLVIDDLLDKKRQTSLVVWVRIHLS
jgi:hypothetical protein